MTYSNSRLRSSSGRAGRNRLRGTSQRRIRASWISLHKTGSGPLAFPVSFESIEKFGEGFGLVDFLLSFLCLCSLLFFFSARFALSAGLVLRQFGIVHWFLLRSVSGGRDWKQQSISSHCKRGTVAVIVFVFFKEGRQLQTLFVLIHESM